MAIAALLLALTLAGPDFRNQGPLKVEERAGAACTTFLPTGSTSGHPVVLWGNGTGGRVATYHTLLRHLASHGFIVQAANTPQAGGGDEMIACLDELARGPFAARADFAKVAAMGHSQGAWGALRAARDRRVAATVPINPGGGNIGVAVASGHTAPMLLVSGGTDRIAPRDRGQALIFRTTQASTFWATLKGAGHVDIIDDTGAKFREAITTWLAWRLKGDVDAARMFEGADCGLCTRRDWTVERK